MKFSQRSFLLLGGLMCIAAFFLPYFNINYGLGKYQVSGLYYVQTAIEYFQPSDANPTGITKVEDKAYDMMYDTVLKAWDKKSTVKLKGMLIAGIIVAMGPFYFLLFGLGYLFRGVLGKVYKRGMIFNILFLGLSYAVFYFINKEVAIPFVSFSFFSIASFGYWIAFAGMFVAAFSDFLGKEE